MMENRGRRLIDVVFSWSMDDVLNEDLYKGQVQKIPKTFSSTTEYMTSFSSSLIEETHADLQSSLKTLSRAPTCEIMSITKSNNFEHPKDFYYQVILERVRKFENNNLGTYEPEFGDLIALTDVRPKCTKDLNRPNKSYVIAFIHQVREGSLSILSSKPIFGEEDMPKSKTRETLYAVYLINMNTNIRVWRALNFELEFMNFNIIQNVLQSKSADAESCTICLSKQNCSASFSDMRARILSSDLNDSQQEAVLSCLGTVECPHQNTVKLIWGPPGTGKTKTVGLLLSSLLRIKCRTLTCAPTNTAVLEVTERLLKRVLDSLEYDTYGLGDIVLFGNGERMKIDDHDELLNIFLDHRADALSKCFCSSSGWEHNLLLMISLLKNPQVQYRLYEAENKEEIADQSSKHKKMVSSQKEKQLKHKEKENGDGLFQDKKNKGHMTRKPLTFEEFFKRRFNCIGEQLKFCIVNLYTHLPTSFISSEVVKKMIKALDFLISLETLLHNVSDSEKRLEQVFSETVGSRICHLEKLRVVRKECLHTLESLPQKFLVPELTSVYKIKDFCLKNACLIFCTASSSAKLHAKGMTPLQLLVIDEAAQLKECESTIPLQLPGLCNAILIGDERQLPAMVKSKISEKADFGRSLFERLVLLRHKKHLLNVQHRMHPSISLFPNRMFYQNQILNGPNVIGRSFEGCFIPGDMYSSYSFINVSRGEEEFDNNRSLKNMVEAAVVSEIVASLFKESIRTKKKVKVGVISPYKAQVYAIGEKVKEYSKDTDSNFSVCVRSVDGFQGGEEDVIIISTVRCNKNGSVGFLSNRQRANVALTRARHCLWILGNGETLTKSGSIWMKLVIDAKKRGCFYNADEDKNLVQAVTAALDSFLFRKESWKVFFSDDFGKSFFGVKNTELRKEVLSLLENLANGWREPHKKTNFVVHDRTSSQLLEQYKVKGLLNLIWTVDILNENSYYIQILKIWDILPLQDTPKLAKRLESLDILFENYTADKMNRCKYKCFNGDLVVPMRWSINLSCPEANPVQSLSTPFSSLGLRNESKTSSSSSSTYGTHEPTPSLPSFQEDNDSLFASRRGWTEGLMWDLVVPKRLSIDLSCSPKANPVQSLSKPLSSLSLRNEPETSSSANGDLVVPMTRSINLSCPKANPVHSLSTPFSSLSLRNESKTSSSSSSSSTYGTHEPTPSLPSFQEDNDSLFAGRRGWTEGLMRDLVVPKRLSIDLSCSPKANNVQSLSKPLSSLSLRNEPETSSSANGDLVVPMTRSINLSCPKANPVQSLSTPFSSLSLRNESKTSSSSSSSSTYGTHEPTPSLPSFQEDNDSLFASRRGWTEGLMRDLVVPNRSSIDLSCSPKANPVQSLSKPLSSFSLRNEPETSSSANGDLVVPMTRSINLSCPKANPVQSLSTPFSSLSLRNESKTSSSSSTYGTHEPTPSPSPSPSLPSFQEDNDSLFASGRGVDAIQALSFCLTWCVETLGLDLTPYFITNVNFQAGMGDLVVPKRLSIDLSCSPKANPVQSLSKPLSSLSLRNEPETSSSANGDLVVPMTRSINLSCPKANPVQSLSTPFSSLSLRNESKTSSSSSTYGTHEPTPSLPSFQEDNDSLFASRRGWTEGLMRDLVVPKRLSIDLSCSPKANNVQSLSKPLSSLSLRNEPETSSSANGDLVVPMTRSINLSCPKANPVQSLSTPFSSLSLRNESKTSSSSSTYGTHEPTPSLPSFQEDNDSLFASRRGWTEGLMRDLVVPKRLSIDLSCSPKANNVQSLSKPLSSLSLRNEPETSSSANGDLVVPMTRSINLSCPKANPVQSLSTPFSSLSLRNESKTSSSSSTYGTRELPLSPSPSLSTFQEDNDSMSASGCGRIAVLVFEVAMGCLGFKTRKS